MPNDYFQFKQFTVQQEDCAMKVCTDACLFGAWVATKVKGFDASIENALDIGTGTGLLSMMVAQESNVSVDSIEIDEKAASQAAANFSKTPWYKKLTVLKGDVKQLSEKKQYDFIFSNPPFFEHDLKSEDAKRNQALHGTELRLQELLLSIQKHLNAKGRFAVLLPYHRKVEFIEMAVAAGFHLEELIQVKQTPKHPFFRAFLLFNPTDCSSVCQDIIIKESNQYSPAFTALLQDFYLAM